MIYILIPSTSACVYDSINPYILIRDLDLVKAVTLKHFDIFMDYRCFIDENQDLFFGKNLVALRGDKWREMQSTQDQEK